MSPHHAHAQQVHLSIRPHRRHTHLLLWGVWFLLNASGAWSADDHGTTPTSDTNRPLVTLQRGETLDAAIRRSLPQLPLKEDFLRQAVVQLNPQVFPKGKAYALRAGTALIMPNLEDLRLQLKSYSPLASSLLQPESISAAGAVPEKATSTGSDKRRWVRFP